MTSLYQNEFSIEKEEAYVIFPTREDELVFSISVKVVPAISISVIVFPFSSKVLLASFHFNFFILSIALAISTLHFSFVASSPYVYTSFHLLSSLAVSFLSG